MVGRRRPVDDGRDALRQLQGEVVEREHGEGLLDLHADVLDAQDQKGREARREGQRPVRGLQGCRR